MTTADPVASAMNAIEHAAAMLAEIRASRLAVRLHQEALGGLLDDDDINHVVALVRSLERPHRAAQGMLPARAANGNGNGARVTGSQKVLP